MSVWAIADPHLSFGVPGKNMDVFGPLWANYTEKLRKRWIERVDPQDLVLMPGDISWAMRPEEALVDLKWIDALPGTKLLLKGNHDYWWGSVAKVRQMLPPSLHCIQNDIFNWKDISIGGARLWDSDAYRFGDYIQFQENARARATPSTEPEEGGKIFARELERLKLSLSKLNPKAKTRIALTHYPPIGADLSPSEASAILEAFHVQICVFGHLHNIKQGLSLFGEARGIRYVLSSCDYLDFTPIKIF